MSKIYQIHQEYLDKVRELRQTCEHISANWYAEIAGRDVPHAFLTKNKIKVCNECSKILSIEQDLEIDCSSVFDAKLKILAEKWNGEPQDCAIFLRTEIDEIN